MPRTTCRTICPTPWTGCCASLEPDLLVFAKLDLWPELSTRAATTGAQVAIVAATVSPGSARLRWPARWLLEAGYQVIAAAAAISHEDAPSTRPARRSARTNPGPGRPPIRQRGRSGCSAVTPDDPLLRFGAGAPDHGGRLHLGSRTRRCCSPHLPGSVAVHPEARLILVPHEPTPAHLDAARPAARASLGLPRPVRLSEAEDPVPLLLVDRLGVLATLYGAGTMAYVGGGFGTAGLHSVLEPAAWGLPVRVWAPLAQQP